MKTHWLKLTAVALILTGTLSSCGEGYIDMSNVDFNNIPNLYEQPLPVIQKAVQGKWEWRYSRGGSIENIIYNNTFVDISKDHVTVYYEDGSQRSFDIVWKREGNTSSIWDKEGNQQLWCFLSIMNDILVASSNSYSSITRGNDIVSKVTLHRFVRVK